MSPPPAEQLYVVGIRPVLLYLMEQSQIEDLGLSDQDDPGRVVPILADTLNWRAPWPYAYGILPEVEPYMDETVYVFILSMRF